MGRPAPLLASPLTSGSEKFRLARKHRGELASWFTHETGWRLVVGAETTRLYKTPVWLDDATRPARAPRTKVPLTRLRYVLLCLALATLERAVVIVRPLLEWGAAPSLRR